MQARHYLSSIGIHFQENSLDVNCLGWDSHFDNVLITLLVDNRRLKVESDFYLIHFHISVKIQEKLQWSIESVFFLKLVKFNFDIYCERFYGTPVRFDVPIIIGFPIQT